MSKMKAADDPKAAFEEYVSILETAILRTEPLSQRARVLTSLQRFAERAIRATSSVANDEPGYRRVSQMLEVREMVRREQAWIDSLLKDEIFEPAHEDLLLLYKMMLAVTESTTVVAVGFIGSDKEGSAEGRWWAFRAGEVLAQTLGLVPELMALPEDRKAE
ncbi:MAG: hypothetical protein Q8Q52_06950 [Acidimicrobiia bacterium]|nr:hypothetical protein [Acidimicrobiia bacterium]